jgi:hypothetical protein
MIILIVGSSVKLEIEVLSVKKKIASIDIHFLNRNRVRVSFIDLKCRIYSRRFVDISCLTDDS